MKKKIDETHKNKTGTKTPVKRSKKAKDALRKSKELYTKLVDTIPDVVLITDLDGKIIFVNNHAIHASGYSRDELEGQNVLNFISSEHQNKAIKNASLIMDSNIGPQDYDFVTKDGKKIPFEVNGDRLINKDGTPLGFVRVCRDITERKRAEEELKNSEALYRLLADNITEHIWIMDLNLNLTYISPSVEKLYGYTMDEVKKLKMKKLFTAESYKKLLEAFSNELSKAMVNPPPPPGTRRVMELEAYHKDGHKLWIENRLHFIRDENGKPLSLMGETRDITERKQAEEALLMSEERYRTILEDIKEGYFEIDLNGNFTFFNDTVCRVLGYSREELMGMNNQQYTEKEELKKVSQAYNKVYATGDPLRDLEWRITRKDGEKKYIEGYISLLKDSSGNPIGFRGIAHDITERKQIEEKLQNEKQRFRALADQSSDIIILVNNKGLITYENQASNILGINAEERIGVSVFDRLHPDDLKFVTDSFNLLFSNPNAPIQKAEMRLRDAEGSWRTFEAIGSNLVHNNIVEYAMVNLRDITERKKSEELLKQSEEKYRLLADHMKDQVWLMDLKMNITYVSPSVERLTGYSSDEIKKLPWDKLLTPESLEKAIAFTSISMPKAIKTASKDLLFRTLELEFILKNGEKIWGECSFGLVRDENGKPVSILGEARNITERKLAEEKLRQTLESLKKAVGMTIHVLVSVLETKDPYTAGHQSRSANLACAIAAEMGLDEDKIEGIRMAGNIHDIGKLSIPSEILTKPTKLTNLEFSLIKVHPQSGYEMLKDVESPWPLAQIVHQHHERMNGTGYPQNLKGDEILIEARIMAVADVVEAMASHRPYRPSLGIDVALDEIGKNKGILYDENVADACLKLFREKRFQLE